MTFLNKAKNILIGDKAFYSKVFAIVFPMIIQNTVTNVVSLVDNIMVGRVGTLEMSSVAIVNQLIFVFNLCIFGGLAGVKKATVAELCAIRGVTRESAENIVSYFNKTNEL